MVRSSIAPIIIIVPLIIILIRVIIYYNTTNTYISIMLLYVVTYISKYPIRGTYNI